MKVRVTENGYRLNAVRIKEADAMDGDFDTWPEAQVYIQHRMKERLDSCHAAVEYLRSARARWANTTEKELERG